MSHIESPEEPYNNGTSFELNLLPIRISNQESREFYGLLQRISSFENQFPSFRELQQSWNSFSINHLGIGANTNNPGLLSYVPESSPAAVSVSQVLKVEDATNNLYVEATQSLSLFMFRMPSGSISSAYKVEKYWGGGKYFLFKKISELKRIKELPELMPMNGYEEYLHQQDRITTHSLPEAVSMELQKMLLGPKESDHSNLPLPNLKVLEQFVAKCNPNKKKRIDMSYGVYSQIIFDPLDDSRPARVPWLELYLDLLKPHTATLKTKHPMAEMLLPNFLKSLVVQPMSDGLKLHLQRIAFPGDSYLEHDLSEN